MRNRYLHIDFQSAIVKESKCNIYTLKLTLEELETLRYLKDNPKATQVMIAEQIHRSVRTVKSMTVRLAEKGYLVRRNGRRDGWWEVVTDLVS